MERKAEENSKLDVFFKKKITEQLRLELEKNTQELVPLKQEWTDFQNSLDTSVAGTQAAQECQEGTGIIGRQAEGQEGGVQRIKAKLTAGKDCARRRPS